jgi:AcrR family transcriptional regulator
VARAGLTTDIVVAEATRLADEVGFDAVTLAALAARFGVAVPSLYKHVAGIDDVRRRVAIRSMRELGSALDRGIARANDADRAEPDDPAGAPDPARARLALRALTDAYRAFAGAHPGRYAATVRAPAPDDDEHQQATRAVLATVMGVLERYDLTGNAAIDAARVVRSALHGFSALHAAGGFGLPRDVERSYGRMVDALHVALREWARG